MRSIPAIITHIKKVLDHLPSTPSKQILRVPNHLRRVKNQAYEPEIISIGPYHRGKVHLAAMEEQKFRYLKLLQQRYKISIEKCVEDLNELSERAVNSYEKRFLEKRRPNDFLETMLVDGCFIMQLILKSKSVEENVNNKGDDPIFRSKMTLSLLRRDLLLAENQLPFFILEKLFDMTLLPNQESNLENIICQFFGIYREHNLPKIPVPHLLGLIYDNLIPSSLKMMPYLNKADQEKQKTNCVDCLSIDCGLIRRNKASKEDDREVRMRCATELHEAGIKFRKVETWHIFDIKFANGALEIPKFSIIDITESVLRNLIAYELLWKEDMHHTVEYVVFMDCLINSNKDVELLRCNGIIENWLGDDDAVANMFNKLLDNVRICRETSVYSEIYLEVNKHCGIKWNVWKAKLKHDYFNSPWAFLSFLAAVLVLLFTAVQAVISFLSYCHS